MFGLPRKPVARLALVLALVVLAAWVVPTFFSAAHYHERLQAALEKALGRPVTFGQVSFHILPGPGFTISNAAVAELPPFGAEPFIQARQIDCELRWRSLWTRRLDVSRLVLAGASLNLVRNTAGQWNLGGLLARRQRRLPSPGHHPPRLGHGRLDIVARHARLNFKIGSNTKPLAVANLDAQLNLDPRTGRVTFRLRGDPIRTDLSIPTPGPLELDGAWEPSASPGGKLDARLQTRGALLDDWVSLVAGHSLGLYGVIDSNVLLSGSLDHVRFQGSASLTQLHRSAALPSAQAVPIAIHWRGDFDRRRRQLNLSSLDVALARSRLHLSGALLGPLSDPHLDMVAAVERSHLQDILGLIRCASGQRASWGLSGRINGMIAVHGLWRHLQWGGFLSVRGGRLTTNGANFPLSPLALRIDRGQAQLAPFRIWLAPRVAAVGVGAFRFPTLGRPAKRLLSTGGDYRLQVSARSIPLPDLLRLGREMGWKSFGHVTGAGEVSFFVTVAGRLRPHVAPQLFARAELQRARLLLPTLTQPLNVPRAELEIVGHRILAQPVVAVMGGSVFSGRLLHEGSSASPWRFWIHANHLNLSQCAAWFISSRQPRPFALLGRWAGLRAVFERHAAASDFFRRLNAEGTVSTPRLQVRNLRLSGFRADISIHQQVVRITHLDFRAGGGEGSGLLVLDAAVSPPWLDARLALQHARVQAIAPYLSPKLAGARGTYSVAGQWVTRGDDGRQMAENFRGSGTLRVSHLTLGHFDLLNAVAQSSGLGSLEPQTSPGTIPSLTARFEVHHGHVLVRSVPLRVGGVALALTGSYTFAGAIRLRVQADFRSVRRHWLHPKIAALSVQRLAKLDLVGTFAGPRQSPRWMFSARLGPAPPHRREAF